MLYVKKLFPEATIPTCSNPGEDLGFDIYALQDRLLYPGRVAMIRTGIAAQFCQSLDRYGHCRYFGFLIRDRSSMAAKGIVVSGGVIDSSYTGEIVVCLTLEHSDRGNKYDSYNITAGDKIAQLIPTEVLTFNTIQVVDELPNQGRGNKGFGSTGR